MKKILLFTAALLLMTGVSFSQKYTNINYNISMPFDASADFTDNLSFRGGSFNYTIMVSDYVGLGFDGSLHTFYEVRENGEITFDNGLLTGKRYNYLNTVPLLFSTRYIRGSENLKAYAGLGIGTMWAEHRSEMGIYTFKESGWHFALSPEAGLMIPFREVLGLNIGLRYHYGFETDDLPADNYLSLAIGLVFIGD